FAMSKYSLLRVAKAQEEAFGAFFKRAKAGLGGQSGYPRYRRASQANWLPHMFASGCKLVPSTGSSHRKWRLRLKGVPGRIRAYGKFPRQPLAWLDADIREHDGTWWLSVCVEVPPRRDPGEASGEIRFDLVDTFAEVRGNLPEPPKWSDILLLQDQMDRLKSERDTRYPRKPGTKPDRKWQKMTGRTGRLSAEIARKRRERLHEWATKVESQASTLEIVAPPIKDMTTSAKGNENDWGAAVQT